MRACVRVCMCMCVLAYCAHTVWILMCALGCCFTAMQQQTVWEAVGGQEAVEAANASTGQK